jgi:hypothetical protein
MFSQLRDMTTDLNLNLKDVQYLAKHASIARLSPKYMGITINKIYPVYIENILQHRKSSEI